MARARRRARLRRAARARPATVEPSVAGPRRPQDRVPLRRCATTSGRTSRTASRRSTTPAEEPLDGDAVDEASAESFPASDPPSFAPRTRPTTPAPPADPVAADAGRSTGGVPAVDDRGRRRRRRRSARARSRSPRSRRARTPRTRRSWSGPGCWPGTRSPAGCASAPTVKTSLAPGLEGGDRLPRGGRADGAARGARVRAGRLRLHDLHRQLRPARRAGRRGRRGERPGRRRRPVGQPQLRGPDPPARAGELPRLAAARRRVRAGRPGRHRPDHASRSGTGSRRPRRSSSPTSGRRPRRSARSSATSIDPELFRRTYAVVFEGDERWRALPIPAGDRYAWDPALDLHRQAAVLRGPDAPSRRRSPTSSGARVLAVLGDSVTTDHISPAGSIAPWSPAGQWLQEHGVGPLEFNSYGARRGHHEVMMRGTFGNIRLRNRLVEGKEGPYTVHLPDGRARRSSTTPRCATGPRACRWSSSPAASTARARRATGRPRARRCSASGPSLAESYERIHRSNLVGMGVLPLQFQPGDSAASLGLTGPRDVHDPRASPTG